jgi:hypothetical protein
MLLTRRPAQPLAAFVEGLWYYDGGDTAEHTDRVLPNGKFQIVIGLSANVGAVSGMRSQHIVVNSGAVAAAMGVVFRPGGARGFFAFPASDFYNHVVSLDAAWHSEVPHLGDRLQQAATPRAKFRTLETVLLELLHSRSEKRIALHPSVQHGLHDFRKMPHIATVMGVAKEAGLSRRRFSQLFDEQVDDAEAVLSSASFPGGYPATRDGSAGGLGGSCAGGRLLRSGSPGARVSRVFWNVAK